MKVGLRTYKWVVKTSIRVLETCVWKGSEGLQKHKGLIGHKSNYLSATEISNSHINTGINGLSIFYNKIRSLNNRGTLKKNKILQNFPMAFSKTRIMNIIIANQFIY